MDKKRSKVIGKFGCRGYDTFGPFKLVGGIAKGHPNEEDIKRSGVCKSIMKMRIIGSVNGVII